MQMIELLDSLSHVFAWGKTCKRVVAVGERVGRVLNGCSPDECYYMDMQRFIARYGGKGGFVSMTVACAWGRLSVLFWCCPLAFSQLTHYI